MKELSWGEIHLGDILFLQQGEKVPADILVLDTQQIENRDAITHVDVRNINGSTICETKKSCKASQISSRSALKLNWSNYQEIIDGKFTF